MRHRTGIDSAGGRTPAGWLAAAACFGLMLAAGGCAPGASAVDGQRAVPRDFALVVACYEHPGMGSSLHVVEPDRTLRAAEGRGIRPDLYPPPTARLTPADYEALYRLVASLGLTEPAGDPAAPASGPRVVVEVQAHGRSVRRVLPLGQDAGAQTLLDRLMELRTR